MKMSKLCTLAMAAIFAAPVVTAQSVSAAQTRAIAKEAYIYGYPMVQAYLTMYAFSIDKNNPQYKGPFNVPLSFARVFTPGDTAFVTPNSGHTIHILEPRSCQKEIDARRSASGGDVSNFFGTRAFLHGDYIARATGAQMGIGANSKEEALYPLYEKDSDGEPLNGSKTDYTLHFAPGNFPPVKAFWSLTMYDLPRQLLVKNPIHRYLINSPMLPQLKRDPDGGLTIYIQADAPGKEREANWLPAPRGPFMLAMRYYLPEPALLNGTWRSPSVVRAK